MTEQNTKGKFTIPGFPFVLKSEAQRDRVLRSMAERAEHQKRNPAPPITHGYGDPNAEFPGDRPEAYSASMTPETFGHFSGDLDSLAAITFSDRTQIHGKLEAGHKPAAGYTVDAAGFVVKVAA